jgi:hypothetical protein
MRGRLLELAVLVLSVPAVVAMLEVCNLLEQAGGR